VLLSKRRSSCNQTIIYSKKLLKDINKQFLESDAAKTVRPEKTEVPQGF
jgi:hypothetical protein